jgi:dihydroorotase (multifunctional complex type)
MHDLAILNGTVVSAGVKLARDVAIADGKVAEVAVPGTLGVSREVIDATGRLVLPGAIDVHFHCRAPSHPERGDFASETRAAVSGGVTTVFEMPISIPACSTPEVLRARRALGEGQCYAHFALYAGGACHTAAAASALAAEGAIGFKIFTTKPPAHRLAEFEGLSAVTEDAIYAALTAIAPTGLTCVFHAENQPLIDFFARSSRDGVPSRPPAVEATEIAIVSALAREVGTPVHIAHLTSAAGLNAVRAAQRVGTPLTAETCPQYLLFTDSAVDRWRAFVKIAPPLREEADVLALWESLGDGTVAVLASDHSPFRPEEKEGVAFSDAPSGMPSVETMYPVLLDAALRGRLALERAVDLVTASPARIFGLGGRKGIVVTGADADLVIFDPAAHTNVRIDHLFTKAARCAVAYDGMALRGTIEQTLVGGQVAYAHGRIIGGPRGRFVQPHSTATTSASEA